MYVDNSIGTEYDHLNILKLKMILVINIFAALFVIFGIGLFFSQARGALLAGVICIVAGAFAFEDKSLMPLAIGFGLLWVLRLLGIEQR